MVFDYMKCLGKFGISGDYARINGSQRLNMTFGDAFDLDDIEIINFAFMMYS